MTTAVPLNLLDDNARAALTGYRNLLLNAGFRVNQRAYADVGAISAGLYTRDRWRIVVATQAINFNSVAGQATAPAGGMEQLVEAASAPAGTYVLSWQGTATATVNGVAVQKGAPFTLAGGASCSVRFFAGTVKEPQLERGTVVTAFERIPYTLDLLLCKRFYQTMNFYVQAAAVGDYMLPINFGVAMRAPPAASVITAGVLTTISVWPVTVVNAETAYFPYSVITANGNARGHVVAFNAELVS